MEELVFTSKDLIRLPAGSKTTLKCRDGRHCMSVATLCYRIPKLNPEYRDRKYSCSIDYIKSEVTIEVKKVEKAKKKQNPQRRTLDGRQ